MEDPCRSGVGDKEAVGWRDVLREEKKMLGGRWFQPGGTTGCVAAGAFAKAKRNRNPFILAGVTSAITSREQGSGRRQRGPNNPRPLFIG